MKRNLVLLVSILQAFVIIPVSHAANSQPTFVRRVSTKHGCGQFEAGGKFSLGTISQSGTFKKLSATAIKKKAKLKKLSKACKRLRGLGASLSGLPSAASFYGDGETESTSVGIHAVSGTPPALTSMASGGGAAYFWRSGVLSRLAANTGTDSDCEEFYGSATDGLSSGLSACRVGENIGQQLFVAQKLDTLSCYFKGAISSSTVGHGVAVTSGSLPDGSADLVFDTPAGSEPRLVKIIIPGFLSDFWVKITSASENTSLGFQYSVESWSCVSGSVTQYESSSVRAADGLFTYRSTFSTGPAAFDANITGYLVTGTDGRLAIDRTQNRTVAITSTGAGVTFGADLTIDPSGVYRQKLYNVIGSRDKRSYEVASISGSGESDFRLLQSAVNLRVAESGTVVASGVRGAEYRDPLYSSAPASTYASEAGSVDLTSDSFFATAPSINFDPSHYSCDETPDLTLTLDPTESALQAIVLACAAPPSTLTNICGNSEVIAAELGYSSQCSS